MKIRKCVGQGQIHRCCMSLEVEASSNQALLIKVNGVILKFTIRTFALITGLNYVGVVEDFKFNIEELNRLIVQYFDGNEIIHRSDLFDRFNGKVWVDNDDDAIKFAILYFIHMFVYSGEKRSLRIPRIHFDLVESGRYMHYPWCRKAFEWLLQSINKVLTTDGQYYRICGMLVVLQIWIYECMGKRQTNFTRKISDSIPRILNWQIVGAKPRFKTLMKDTFNDGNREIKWKNVVPSLMEIAVLQLPPEGVEKSIECVQTEPHRDIDEQVLSGQNIDDYFVNPPPPSMKVREEFKDIRKFINDNFNIIMSTLKDKKNNDNAGQGSQPFTSTILSENQNQSECDESSNDGSEEVFQDHSIFENSNLGDIPDIVGSADKQVYCYNSPVRVDAGFSLSKSIIPSIPQPSFVFDKPKKIRPLVFESQHDFTDQDDNDEEDHFIFHIPIQSIDPLEGSPQSQFELDDSLMPSISNIKSTSSVQPIIFELKHPFIFDLISGNRDIIMWDAHRSWIHEGLSAKHENKRHDQDRYKKGKAHIPVPFDFGLDIVNNKNCFYNLYSKGQLLNDSKAKYDVDSRAAGHDAAIRKEVTKLAQLIPLKLTMSRYATLLWNYAKQKQDNGTISESEAPPRHAMPQSVR
uniref:DUF1985 domain-containing protein n=1 Tax=Solanum lycopersicum TaxID=4081 RepID=A0A3Q7H842_SOLLC